MSSFHDSRGNRWRIRLDAPTIFAVRQECNVDLVGVNFSAAVADSLRLTEVLCAVLNTTTLNKTLTGDSLDDAELALVTAIAEFYPDPAEVEQAAEGAGDDSSETDNSEETFDAAKECLRMAGVLNVSPDNRTYRDLFTMMQGRREFLEQMYGDGDSGGDVTISRNPAILQQIQDQWNGNI